MKYRSRTFLTQWPARTATSSKDTQTGAFSIGLTNPGKLGCPTKKKKSVALMKNLQILMFEMVMRNEQFEQDCFSPNFTGLQNCVRKINIKAALRRMT
jgi:hypothetical protein